MKSAQNKTRIQVVAIDVARGSHYAKEEKTGSGFTLVHMEQNVYSFG